MGSTVGYPLRLGEGDEERNKPICYRSVRFHASVFYVFLGHCDCIVIESAEETNSLSLRWWDFALGMFHGWPGLLRYIVAGNCDGYCRNERDMPISSTGTTTNSPAGAIEICIMQYAASLRSECTTLSFRFVINISSSQNMNIQSSLVGAIWLLKARSNYRGYHGLGRVYCIIMLEETYRTSRHDWAARCYYQSPGVATERLINARYGRFQSCSFLFDDADL